jgi:hypothetical protein
LTTHSGNPENFQRSRIEKGNDFLQGCQSHPILIDLEFGVILTNKTTALPQTKYSEEG